MTDPAAIPTETVHVDAREAVDGAADWARPLIERQLQVLGRLAEAGLEIALAIERQATAAAGSAPVQGDAALAYARVARAVRMTVLLQSKLIKELQFHDAAIVRGLDRARAAQEEARLELQETRKARVERIVERVAKAACGDPEEVERLVGEAGERLDDDDRLGDVLERPMGEIVALICRDLGLDPDWARLAEEAWARDEIESAAAASPFAGAGAGLDGPAAPRWRPPEPPSQGLSSQGLSSQSLSP